MKSDNKNSVIALGSGTSTGIPMIGCTCKVCTSLDHRDQRLRTSILIESKSGRKILVDTTPDLRTQILNNQICDVDFVIMTHDHADHLNGIDDLRPFTFGPPIKEINLYCNKSTYESIARRFEYIFIRKEDRLHPILGGGIPKLKLNEVKVMEETIIEGEEFLFFNHPHGHGETLGFIHQGLAYIVDCTEIPESVLTLLKQRDIKLLLIDCVQRSAHRTHLNVDQSFAYIREINPERAGLIHMGHDLSHRELLALASAQFKDKVFPVFDQLKLFY